MVIGWWSGGVTSAVACKLAIDLYGRENNRVIMIDTKNEHEDTYRFKEECEKWYGVKIETLSAIGDTYKNIEDVWRTHKSLNVASGAVCSYMLKRRVREKWEKYNKFTHQVFGFEFEKKEFNRAKSLQMNHGHTHPIFPLLMFGYDKEKCISILQGAGIKVPQAYMMGFRNNNCLKTGCTQGGIGYWKKMQKEYPDKFNKMADMEHELTAMRGSPVTMLKDQSKAAKESGNVLVFLKKNPEYPELKCIDDMEARPIEPLQECNGLCGVNDLNKPNQTLHEINWADDGLNDIG